MRKYLIQKLGGYPDIESALKASHDKDNAEPYELLTKAVSKLFNTVSSEDILRQVEGRWMFGTKQLAPEELKALSNSAKAFMESRLFKVLDEDIKYHTNTKVRQATTLMQLEGAKCLEFVWDILKTRLREL